MSRYQDYDIEMYNELRHRMIVATAENDYITIQTILANAQKFGFDLFDFYIDIFINLDRIDDEKIISIIENADLDKMLEVIEFAIEDNYGNNDETKRRLHNFKKLIINKKRAFALYALYALKHTNVYKNENVIERIYDFF